VLVICFAPSLADSILFLTLTRLVVVFIFVNFSFALFTPPLGDYQVPLVVTVVVQLIVVMHILHSQIPLFNKCQMMLTKVCYLLFLPPVKSTLKPYHLKNTKKLQMIDVTKSTRIIEFVYCKLTCVAP
jgi:Ca2+/Na+ antiporter